MGTRGTGGLPFLFASVEFVLCDLVMSPTSVARLVRLRALAVRDTVSKTKRRDRNYSENKPQIISGTANKQTNAKRL